VPPSPQPQDPPPLARQTSPRRQRTWTSPLGFTYTTYPVDHSGRDLEGLPPQPPPPELYPGSEPDSPRYYGPDQLHELRLLFTNTLDTTDPDLTLIG
jgi:hypothetical protein